MKCPDPSATFESGLNASTRRFLLLVVADHGIARAKKRAKLRQEVRC